MSEGRVDGKKKERKMYEIEYEVCREDINCGKPVIETACADSDGTLEYVICNLKRAGYTIVTVWRV
jgi:hypothetical protein